MGTSETAVRVSDPVDGAAYPAVEARELASWELSHAGRENRTVSAAAWTYGLNQQAVFQCRLRFLSSTSGHVSSVVSLWPLRVDEMQFLGLHRQRS